MALGLARMGAFAGYADLGVVDADVVLALYLQRFRIAADIDRITAAALRLAADRTVAALIGNGGGAVQRKLHSAAMTGAFELHGCLRVIFVGNWMRPVRDRSRRSRSNDVMKQYIGVAAFHIRLCALPHCRCGILMVQYMQLFQVVPFSRSCYSC